MVKGERRRADVGAMTTDDTSHGTGRDLIGRRVARVAEPFADGHFDDGLLREWFNVVQGSLNRSASQGVGHGSAKSQGHGSKQCGTIGRNGGAFRTIKSAWHWSWRNYSMFVRLVRRLR